MECKVEMIPQMGIVLDGKTIRLGDTKADVERLLGEPDSVHKNSLYYFRSELHIVLDGAGRVEFIELMGGPDGKLQPVIFGLEAFREEPGAVARLLAEKNGPDIDDTERGYSFAFKKLSVGLYRQNTPENVEDMIEEAEDEGEPMDKEDIAYEMRRTHWATIGVGVENYYQ